jgi:hypothetical protein
MVIICLNVKLGYLLPYDSGRILKKELFLSRLGLVVGAS